MTLPLNDISHSHDFEKDPGRQQSFSDAAGTLRDASSISSHSQWRGRGQAFYNDWTTLDSVWDDKKSVGDSHVSTPSPSQLAISGSGLGSLVRRGQFLSIDSGTNSIFHTRSPTTDLRQSHIKSWQRFNMLRESRICKRPADVDSIAIFQSRNQRQKLRDERNATAGVVDTDVKPRSRHVDSGYESEYARRQTYDQPGRWSLTCALTGEQQPWKSISGVDCITCEPTEIQYLPKLEKASKSSLFPSDGPPMPSITSLVTTSSIDRGSQMRLEHRAAVMVPQKQPIYLPLWGLHFSPRENVVDHVRSRSLIDWTSQPKPCDPRNVTPEHLMSSARSVYRRLVNLEQACQKLGQIYAKPQVYIDPERWRPVTDIHCRLLNEYHDFLTITQHPTAPVSLRRDPTAYGTPARMWKRGIHCYLEVLRSHRPGSQDCMSTFIQFCYQLIALLLETVGCFSDIWIECLGDLARYRMAVEIDKETRDHWAGVAFRWYTIAAGRHPCVGRLNHHLGILERASVNKMYYYTKSLTCVIPFHTARQSLLTVCAPITREGKIVENSQASAEACLVTLHALIFTDHDSKLIPSVADTAIRLWKDLSLTKLNDIGVPLALTNIAAVFDFGNPQNILLRLFRGQIDQKMDSTDNISENIPEVTHDATANIASSIPLRLCYACLNAVLHRPLDQMTVDNVLPFIHVMLAWLYSLSLLSSHQLQQGSKAFIEIYLSVQVVAWKSLADLLNLVSGSTTSHTWTEIISQTRKFPPYAKVLSEDYFLRGYAWTQLYLPSKGWFDDNAEVESRMIETPSTLASRRYRVQWLAVALASRTGFLNFNRSKRCFAATLV